MDLLFVVVLSVALAPLALLSGGLLQAIIGLLFVLFFPGYVLLAALFPRKNAFSGLERVALSFGLSLAVVPLIGLILNFTPLGIRLGSTLFSVLGFILVWAFVAFRRRKGLSPEERFEVRFGTWLPRLAAGWQRQAGWDRLLTAVLVAAAVMSVGTLVYALSVEKTGERFTQFYLLDLDSKTEGYPRELAPGDSGRVILNIVNNEQAPVVYRVKMTIAGEEAGVLGPVSLDHEEKWEQEVSFAFEKPGGKQKVEFLLYKGEAGEPDLRLHLWVDVKEVP